MRKTFIIPALLAMLVMGAAQAFAQTATVVTQSGQRIRGQIMEMGNSGTVVVRANGRDNRIPIGDVSVIDFVGNGTNVPQNEWQRANQNGGMVVLRNGRTINGRLVDMPPYSNQAVLAGRSGQQNVVLNQVARIYFGGSGSNQYNPNYNPNNYPRNGNYGQYGNNGQYGNRGPFGQPGSNINRTVTVPTNQLWTDSGINVQQGQVVHFQASGRISLSHNPGDVGGPAGADGPPFAIGAQSDITMQAGGRLSLGVNDDYVQDNSGNFVVNIR